MLIELNGTTHSAICNLELHFYKKHIVHT